MPIAAGRLLRTPSLPLVWGVNQLWLGEAVRFEEAVALAERHLAKLPFRHLTVDDQRAGPLLEARFSAAGWKVDRELTMVLARGADRMVDTTAVSEVPAAEALELMICWQRESPAVGRSAETDRQLVELWRREWSARNARLLGVRSRSGQLAAITALYSGQSVAQVEDVYTLPEQRGQGFARTLVSRALELAASAGPELTFIVADDRGWPKQLYARLGFEPALRTWSFHRDQAPAR